MRHKTLLISLPLLVLAHCSGRESAEFGGSQPPARSYRRIISLAPSVTETLFVVGLGDRVVGVTRFCRYPVGAQSKARVGGYYDQNYEEIISLKPDLVVMLPEHEEQKRKITALGIPVLVLDHRSINGILNSISDLGTVCEVEEKATDVVKDLRDRIERVRHKTRKLLRPRVIVSVGRNMGSGALGNVYLSGRRGFYNEMIQLAGGVNAYQGSAAFPVFTTEGIARVNPNVVIDLVPGLEEQGWNPAAICKEWEAVFRLTVRDGRVRVLGQDYVVVPGPRMILILQEMARIIHPEVDWEEP